jgi:murein DD-endopeptidase MepM/ murein hydrolase activator NlpD
MTYWHFDQVMVSGGQAVKQGDPLGLSGTSGGSSGLHLHAMLMGSCATGYCQSLPLTYVEAGAPACAQKVTSQNCP